jgi:hypothetical protein
LWFDCTKNRCKAGAQDEPAGALGIESQQINNVTALDDPERISRLDLFGLSGINAGYRNYPSRNAPRVRMEKRLRTVSERYSRWRWACRSNGWPWDTKLAVKPLGSLEWHLAHLLKVLGHQTHAVTTQLRGVGLPGEPK